MQKQRSVTIAADGRHLETTTVVDLCLHWSKEDLKRTFHAFCTKQGRQRNHFASAQALDFYKELYSISWDCCWLVALRN